MENKNMELENQNVETIEEGQTEKKGLGSRIAGGVKKHWKGALLALGLGVLGFVAGSKTVKVEDYEEINDPDVECIEGTVEDDE